MLFIDRTGDEFLVNSFDGRRRACGIYLPRAAARNIRRRLIAADRPRRTMKIKSFEFNLRELAGSMGDFGTLFPFAIGYIAVNRPRPGRIPVMMGAANIATGWCTACRCRSSPMKVLAATAIAMRWAPETVYASAFATGVIWLIISLTGAMKWLARVTPLCVCGHPDGTRRHARAAGLSARKNLVAARGHFHHHHYLLRENRYAPAAVVLMALGAAIVVV